LNQSVCADQLEVHVSLHACTQHMNVSKQIEGHVDRQEKGRQCWAQQQ
jgi:hypothetical protein